MNEQSPQLIEVTAIFCFNQSLVNSCSEYIEWSWWLERPLYFDPFGQTGFAPVGHNIIAPCKVLVQGSILFYPFRDSGFS